MALFKILKGEDTNSTLQNLPLNDGYCYFDTKSGLFYIDSYPRYDNSGNGLGTLARGPINAQKAIADVNGTIINLNYAHLPHSIDNSSTVGSAYCPVYINTAGVVTPVTYVDIAHGGTGNTSFAASRLIYSSSNTKLAASGHYASSTKIAINSTTAPTETLYVNGTATISGNTTIGTPSTAANLVTHGALTVDNLTTLKSGANISATETGSGQESVLKVLSTKTSANSSSWIGRAIIGAEDLTFLMGTYKGLAGIGAHSWTSAAGSTGGAWAPIYFNPDGTAPLYFGANGTGWTAGTGTLVVTGSNTVGGGSVVVNGTTALQKATTIGTSSVNANLTVYGNEIVSGDITAGNNFYSKGYYVSNCNTATTSPYQFGFYQWNNEFQFTYRDSNNNYLGQAFGIDAATGSSRWSHDAKYDSGANIYPVTNNTNSVGLSDHKFADMYATTFHGSFDGTATRSKYLETWNTAKTQTYGTSYPLYAWWRNGSRLKLVCDNYTVETDYADYAGRLDVVSTDNAIARFNGTNGTIQNSGVLIDDSNNVTVPGTMKIGQCTLQYNSTTKSLNFIF